MTKGIDSNGNPKRTARPTTTPTASKQPAHANTWKKATFVSPNLTEAQKAAFNDWASRVDFADVLFKVLDSGYKISAKWDDYSAAYMALLQPTSEQSPNDGYILTARARDPLTAMYRAIYVHAVVLEADWTDYLGRQEIDW